MNITYIGSIDLDIHLIISQYFYTKDPQYVISTSVLSVGKYHIHRVNILQILTYDEVYIQIFIDPMFVIFTEAEGGGGYHIQKVHRFGYTLN